VPCDVWPESAHPRDLVLAGVTINEQRQPHSCLAIARRLRAVKNQFAESHAHRAARTGLPNRSGEGISQPVLHGLGTDILSRASGAGSARKSRLRRMNRTWTVPRNRMADEKK
jgi:hypothetical protein